MNTSDQNCLEFVILCNNRGDRAAKNTTTTISTVSAGCLVASNRGLADTDVLSGNNDFSSTNNIVFVGVVNSLFQKHRPSGALEY